MAYYQSVIAIRRELPLSAICDWDIVQGITGFESEGWDDSYLLVWDEGCEWVLGLSGGSLYGI